MTGVRRRRARPRDARPAETPGRRPRPAPRKDSPVSAAAPRWVRSIVENVEALTVALIMALLVRQFVLEAFKIPSDSMFPTLNGDVTNGDRVIVNKWALLLGEPRRWDVTVFKYPLDIRRNFIKRLVGMPGERLTVVDGDIWINQRIERKPDRVQRSIWFERFPEVPAFQLPPDRCQFKAADRGWRGADDHFVAEPPPGATIRLDLDFGTPVPMDRESTYEDVRDYRLRGTVTAAAGATFGVEMRVRDVPFRVWLGAGSRASRVDFPRHRYPLRVVEEKGKGRALPVDTAVDFEVAHWDWRFEVRVDGEVWFRYELNPKPWTLVSKGARWPEMFPVEPTAIAVTVRGGRVALTDLAVDQDLHYTRPADGIWDTKNYTFHGRPLEDGRIPAGYYFMMGDNSHGSRDSRLWHRIMMKDPKTGRPMTYPWNGKPVWGEEYTWGLDSDHMHNENTVNFVDLYGNGYWVPNYDRRAPVDTALNSMILRLEPYGLVPRHHLVGRAFCVFWPFPPFSRSFRPKYVR